MSRLLCAFLLVAGAARAQDVVSTSVIVPVVGSVTGSNETLWRTEIELRNDMRSEATVALSLPTAPDQPMILLTMPPGGIQRFNDVAGEAFSVQNVLSPLLVQTLGKRSVRVVANAYGMHAGGLTKPQPIPLVDPGASFPLRVLPSLAYSDSFRTNIGLVNLGDQEAVFALGLRGQSGETVATARAVVPPGLMWHMALQLLFPAMNKADNYTLLVETGARDTYAYASVVDNATNEARFITAGVSAR